MDYPGLRGKTFVRPKEELRARSILRHFARSKEELKARPMLPRCHNLVL
jgi:hypothetical protein